MDTIKDRVLKDTSYLLQLNQKSVFADSVLTTLDYFDLYYGSAYLEGYSPYTERSAVTMVYTLLEEEKYAEAKSFSESLILSNPGFVRPFYLLGISCDRMGDTASASKFFTRYYDYLSIPYFSGTGNSADSAFVVRSIDDEYLIFAELGLQSSSQSLIYEKDIPFDILYVRSESDTTEREMYFNIAQPFLLGLNFGNANDLEVNDKRKDKKKKRKEKKSKKK